MERLDGVGLRPVEHVPALAPRLDEPDVEQHAEMLGDGRLRQAQRRDDVVDGPFAGREKLQDVAPAGSAIALKESEVVAARGMT